MRSWCRTQQPVERIAVAVLRGRDEIDVARHLVHARRGCDATTSAAGPRRSAAEYWSESPDRAVAEVRDPEQHPAEPDDAAEVGARRRPGRCRRRWTTGVTPGAREVGGVAHGTTYTCTDQPTVGEAISMAIERRRARLSEVHHDADALLQTAEPRACRYRSVVQSVASLARRPRGPARRRARRPGRTQGRTRSACRRSR